MVYKKKKRKSSCGVDSFRWSCLVRTDLSGRAVRPHPPKAESALTVLWLVQGRGRVEGFLTERQPSLQKLHVRKTSTQEGVRFLIWKMEVNSAMCEI